MKKHHAHASTTRKSDASRDVTINPVQLPDGTIVSWAEAFPQVEVPRTIPRDA